MNITDNTLLTLAVIVLLLALMAALLVWQMKQRHTLLRKRDETIAREEQEIEQLTTRLSKSDQAI